MLELELKLKQELALVLELVLVLEQALVLGWLRLRGDGLVSRHCGVIGVKGGGLFGAHRWWLVWPRYGGWWGGLEKVWWGSSGLGVVH